MGVIILLTGYQGRTPVTHYLLAATAAIMALSDPTILVYDIGFQLSFASMAGITYITPRISKTLKKGQEGVLRDIIATTAGAHLAVLPLAWWYFGNFSPLSLATNVLIVPLIPLVMGAGTLLVGSAAVSHGFASIVALGLDPILRYILAVVVFFGR
jgi:competence protein ComEC